MGARHERLDFVRLVEQARDMADFEEAIAAAVRAMPADAASILDFLEIPASGAFDVPPEQAIGYFKAKGLKPSFSYAELLDHQHDVSFTVAKMMDVDMLGQVRASLDSALANGTPFKEWADTITPILQSGGWWGRKRVVDPLSGQEIVAQLGSPWRLETIFRTNMQTAYAAGAWQEIEAQEELAPFLMYDAVDDFRTRPLHASWDRKVLPVASHWWSAHYPPNGWNCRCGVIQLSADEAQAMGLQILRDPPDDGTYKWTNPRTGDVHHIPNGLDPGFEHNAGKSWSWKLDELLQEKVEVLPPDMAAAAKKAIADARAMKVVDAAKAAVTKAQQDMAAAASKAALERAKALAADKAAQWGAQQQLDAIGKGKETAGAGAAYKIKALAEAKKGSGWSDMKPSEQLDVVFNLAADLKVKADLSKTLSLYKSQILAGKVPSPAATKAFKSLTDEDAAAFLAKIDAEKAAIVAKAKALADAEAAAAAAAAPATPPPKALVVSGTPPNPATLTKIGEQRGSNPGGTYQDTDTGITWYIKQPNSAEMARNEVLAAKLYEAAGIDVPELHLVTMGGKTSIASRIVDGLAKADASALAGASGTAQGFAVDAWLANWDVVGLGFDNLLLRGARVMRVDTGGALRFRAQGSLKGSAFGDTVTELDSLRDASLNRQSAAVFGRLTKEQIEDSVVQVLRLGDADIRQIVEQFGPLDLRERAALADRLIARRADLAARFPAAAERVRREAGASAAAPAAPARVTAAEQQAVEASRVNGYGFATDSDQIEDNMVVVHAFRRAGGADATRGFMKLLPGASRDLQRTIAAIAGDTPAVGLAAARQAILDAVKSINFRASKGAVLEQKVVDRIKAMQVAVSRTLAEIDKAAATAKDPTALKTQRQLLEAWSSRVAGYLDDAVAGRKAVAIPGQFPAGSIPDAIEYAVDAPGTVGPKWRRVDRTFEFTTATFDRSFATENTGKASVQGANLRYETELADGTKVVYFPHDEKVAFAMRGVVQIDVPGRGVAPTERVFGSMSEIGLTSVRAAEVDRQHLYLNAFARIRLLRGASARYQAEFDAIKDRGPDGVIAKLDLLKRATGVDVAESEGWKTIDGVRQAFGHGRAYQHRPDLDPAEMRELDRTHVLYHNPQGLGTDAGRGVFERVKAIIDGGGVFASLTDRVRRGVALSGSSVSSDLASGGGDYHFTRIRARKVQAGSTGVYWRTSVLRRMDAITYQSDQFGRTTEGTIEKYRLGQTVGDFRDVAGSSGNETIFKGGLSVFDDVDRIVLSSDAEVKDAIAWMQSRGYKAWPDGRPLAEVIITKAKHSAKP